MRNRLAFFVLLLVLLLLCSCGTAQPDSNVSLEFKDSNVCLTYDTGETASVALSEENVPLDAKEASLIGGGVSCALDQGTTVLFVPGISYASGKDGTWRTSPDHGKTWTSQTVSGSGQVEITRSALGLTSKKDGWLLLQGTLGTGTTSHILFRTEDGGASWTQTQIGAPVEPLALDYCTFLTREEGFLSVGAGYDGAAPHLYRTQDAGQTWKRCMVKTDRTDGWCNVQSVVCERDKYVMTCAWSDGAQTETISFRSSDGITWMEAD